MIHDRQPYFVKRLYGRIERWYTNHFVAPHLESLGSDSNMMKPWFIDVHGAHITIGNNIHVVTAPDRRVSLSTWHFEDYQGHIAIGDHCLICPGVRMDSGSSITIGDNCMFAAGSYITDADWHDLYDRTKSVGVTKPVILSDNVWIGDGAIVCKGITIGENSIVGAGAVVTSDVPANSVAAGNPARIVKQLDQDKTIVTRAHLFRDVAALNAKIDDINRYTLSGNSFWNWLRSLLFPRRGD
ncbi:MAG: acyltransferase [bacterium]|nr:acyltransferase [Gammaproteobacteria bacterium]HIL97005.1 acyltransferase [Pseudomonadales bacterium]